MTDRPPRRRRNGPTAPGGPEPESEQIAGREFALKEHSAMLAKLERSGEDIYRVEILVPTAIAALFVWLMSKGGDVPSWLYFLLPAIALLGGLRYLARLRYVSAAEAYVRELETRLRGRGWPKGWEHFYERSGRVKWYTRIRCTYWILLIGATAYVAVAKFRFPSLLE